MIEPLELAVRCEDFDDDRSRDQAETADYRILTGFNYGFLDFATFSFECCHIAFEEESGGNAVDDQNELHFRVAVEF